MHDVDAFEESVSAYPAVTVIRRAEQSTAVVANATKSFGEANAPVTHEVGGLEPQVSEYQSRVSSEAARVVRLRTLMAVGRSGEPRTRGRSGAAAFRPCRTRPPERVSASVWPAERTRCTSPTTPNLVEPDRLLPLLMTRDTSLRRSEVVGHISRQSMAGRSPRRPRRLPTPREVSRLPIGDVRNRHVAQKNPSSWYRTIDRVEPGLRDRDKLVIPDLKAYIQPVLDRGEHYPHHGLYFVTSDEWDLEVLGGLLLSDIAELFVATYCVKMRGGCYRFQAQYLRRIRVPHLADLDSGLATELAAAFRTRDRAMPPNSLHSPTASIRNIFSGRSVGETPPDGETRPLRLVSARLSLGSTRGSPTARSPSTTRCCVRSSVWPSVPRRPPAWLLAPSTCGRGRSCDVLASILTRCGRGGLRRGSSSGSP